MSSDYRSGMIETMKIIAFILSFVLVINEGLARKPSLADYQLAFEQKLLESVALWNSARNYDQLIDKMPATQSEKAFLKSLLKKEGLSKAKPVKVDFVPAQHKLNVHFNKSTHPIYLLSVAPTILTYDGQEVFEFRPKSAVKDYFEYLNKDSGKRKAPSKGQRKSVFWQMAVPKAEAQFYTPEQQAQIDAQYKKEAERQSDLVKKILMVTLVSFVGFLAIFWAWNKWAHHLNPSWGSEGAARTREDRELAKEHFPEVDKVLFKNDEPLEFFTCESPQQSSKLQKIRFKGKTTTEFDFTKDGYDLETLIKQKGPYAERLEKAEYCCQHHPCSVWVANRILGIEDPSAPANSESGTGSK